MIGRGTCVGVFHAIGEYLELLAVRRLCDLSVCRICDSTLPWCAILWLESTGIVRDHAARIPKGSFDRRVSIHNVALGCVIGA